METLSKKGLLVTVFIQKTSPLYSHIIHWYHSFGSLIIKYAKLELKKYALQFQISAWLMFCLLAHLYIFFLQRICIHFLVFESAHLYLAFTFVANSKNGASLRQLLEGLSKFLGETLYAQKLKLAVLIYQRAKFCCTEALLRISSESTASDNPPALFWPYTCFLCRIFQLIS